MSDLRVDDLEARAAAAALRLFGARRGLEVRDSGGAVAGTRFALGSVDEPEELFFALLPAAAGYLSLSLVLVVDEDFFRGHVEEILAVTARYEVSASLSRDDLLGAGEVYLNLSLRLFLPGFVQAAFDLALDNLRASRDALARTFP